MIQPNEKLLPGNVVMYHGVENGDMPCKLDAADIYQNSWLPELHSPIPLTHEILVQWCGIGQIGGFYELNIGGLIILFPMSITGILSIMDAGLDSINIKCPEHLHTLQNLIYFLSGEEMPVNIPNH